MTRKELLLLATLAAVQFTHIMDFMIMMPLSPHLIRHFNVTPQEFGLLVSSYSLAAGISGFAASFFVDRFDRKSALFWMYAGFAFGTLMCAIAPDYRTLLLARTLAGVFGGVMGGLIFAIVGDAIPGEKRGRAMGLVMMSFSFASVVGVPSGLKLANIYGWHAPFFLLAITGVGLLALIERAIPAMGAHVSTGAPDPFATLRGIAGDSNQLRALALTLFLMVGHFAIIPYIPVYLTANVGLSEDDLVWMYLVGGLSTIITSYAVGHMVDRFGRFRVFAGFMVFASVPIYLITNLPAVGLAWTLVATTLFFVASNGRIIPAMTMATSAVPMRQRGGFMSVNASVQSIGSGLAALIGGLIIRQHNGGLERYEWVGYFAIAMSFIGIYLASRLRTAEERASETLAAGPAAART